MKGAVAFVRSGGTVTATTIAGGDLDLSIGAKITRRAKRPSHNSSVG